MMWKIGKSLGPLAAASGALLVTTSLTAAEPQQPTTASETEAATEAALPAPVNTRRIAPAAAPGVQPAIAPYVIGEYRVGYIPHWPIGYFTGHSLYNPYLDLLCRPIERTVCGTRLAQYYVAYRTLPHRVNWGTMYLPRRPAARRCPPGAVPAKSSGRPSGRMFPYGPGAATYFGYTRFRYAPRRQNPAQQTTETPQTTDQKQSGK